MNGRSPSAADGWRGSGPARGSGPPPSRQKSKRDSAYRLYATSRKPMESVENAFGVDDGDGAVGTGHDLRHRPRAAARPPRRSRFGRELLGRRPLRDDVHGRVPASSGDGLIHPRARREQLRRRKVLLRHIRDRTDDGGLPVGRACRVIGKTWLTAVRVLSGSW
jgi:hypothetical protein